MKFRRSEKNLKLSDAMKVRLGAQAGETFIVSLVDIKISKKVYALPVPALRQSTACFITTVPDT